MCGASAVFSIGSPGSYNAIRDNLTFSPKIPGFEVDYHRRSGVKYD